MILGLTSALVAAVCYGFGSILQAVAVKDTTASAGLDVALLARLVSQWRYIGGLALDLAGFVASVAALRTLPLFVVQAAVASSVGVTALGATYLLGTRLEPRERAALVVLIGGLVLLGITGRPEHATHLGEPGPALILGSAGVIALVAAGLARAGGTAASSGLAAGAGASFGAVGIAARAFAVPDHWTHVVADPLAYAIVVHGVLAVLLFAAALQRGGVTSVAAITFAVETVIPAAIGLAVLGDHARPGLLPVAMIGFGLTLVASIGLARYADPVAPQEPQSS